MKLFEMGGERSAGKEKWRSIRGQDELLLEERGRVDLLLGRNGVPQSAKETGSHVLNLEGLGVLLEGEVNKRSE